MKKVKKLSTFLLLLAALCSNAQQSCELVVKVENIKTQKGSIMIAVYDHQDRFLSKEILSDGKIINKDVVEFSFKGLGEGFYAISIFQDENGNGKLDSNFMGIPTEPYAFSNNAKGMFGPPSFEDCRFEVAQGGNEIVIRL
ncbi:MAG: DUF2141 domain-containing protein [Ekhidna sp.]|uniref:DUF2141 domain-containing protein n=1 Tax=Ekhidna sp. TaxID=2608089 RepID=UPI0032EB359C